MEISVAEAGEKFEQIVARVEAGETVVLVRDDKIVATLSPGGAENRRRASYGSLKGKIWMADDFDDPLPDDMLKKIYE